MMSRVVFRALVALVSSKLITSQATASTVIVTTRSCRVGLTDLSESIAVTTVNMPL